MPPKYCFLINKCSAQPILNRASALGGKSRSSPTIINIQLITARPWWTSLLSNYLDLIRLVGWHPRCHLRRWSFVYLGRCQIKKLFFGKAIEHILIVHWQLKWDFKNYHLNLKAWNLTSSISNSYSGMNWVSRYCSKGHWQCNLLWFPI